MSERFGRRVSDWLKLRCGDLVTDREDGRHVGRVEAIRHGAFVTVRWLENGWCSELPISRVERVKD
jgi:hypothetical protein